MSLAVGYPYLVRQTAQMHARLSWLRMYGDAQSSSLSMILPRWMRVPVNLVKTLLGLGPQAPVRVVVPGLPLLRSTAGTYTTRRA